MRRALALAALPLLAAACGGSGKEPAASPPPPQTVTVGTTTPGTTTSGGAETRSVTVYFLRDGKVAAARRLVPASPAPARQALEALAAGPTAAERRAGLTTGAPASMRIERLVVDAGTADVALSPCPPAAQLVYTLTQFPTVQRVTGPCAPGGPLARADLEGDTPPVLVESPTVGERVESPLRARGTANTFEATFQLEIRDAAGKVVRKSVVTATSGSGTRGTFDVTVPFTVARPGGSLVVYELSAEDGSRIHEVEIPLDLQPG